MILEARDIHAYYGDSHVLQGVSLSVGGGEIVCLLGRNGAGKSTTLKGILGLVPPARGQVFFAGREITRSPVYDNVREGVGYVPEDRRIFPGLTVEENLEVARLPQRPGQSPWDERRIFAAFPLLAPLRRRKGGHLSGGEQQMLSIARALCGNPRLLLLDEPSEGLAPLIVEQLGATISLLKGEVPILLAEQNARFALAIANRGYVLDKGVVRFAGSREELLGNPEVQSRYLAV